MSIIFQINFFLKIGISKDEKFKIYTYIYIYTLLWSIFKSIKLRHYALLIFVTCIGPGTLT